MKPASLSHRRESVLLSLALLGVCLLLAFFVPYVHDDWDWGSAGGMERLSTFFQGYNGRYMGNLLVMALTRSVLLKTVVMGLVLFLTLILLGRETRGQGVCLTAIGATLFFTLSRAMAEQSIGWISAFCNYGVGALVLLLFLRRAFCCFEGPRTCRPLSMVAYALLGFAGALLMENITIALCVLSFLLCVYTWGRDRRPDGVSVCFFIGSVLGAMAMFSNSAYGLIASNRDFYRTMAFQYWQDWDTVIEQALWFYRNYHIQCLFYEALPLLFTLLVFALAAIYRLRTSMDARRRAVCNVIAAVLCLYPLYAFLCAYHPDWEPFLSYTDKAEALLGTFYIVAIVALPLALPVGRVRRLRMLTLVLAVGVLSGPLLFVTPIGERCFYPMFILEIAYVLELARVCGAARYYKTFLLPLLCVLGALCIFWLSIYGRNAMVSDVRAKAAQREAAQGQKTIRISALPYEDYSWDSTPYEINESWYKAFYDIAQDVRFEPISYNIFYQEHKNDE